MTNLASKIEQLKTIFEKNEDRYKAHEESKAILLEMAKDKEILTEIIDFNISDTSFFHQKRITPTIAFEIETNDMFSFRVHCWLPQPDLDTEISNQSIHHHGDLILTSVAAYGPGYESILFKKGFSYDKKTHEAKLEIEKIYKNPYLNIEFIDINTPHIVFYPNSLSLTFPLWSNYRPKLNEKLRNSGFIQKNRRKIRKILDVLNLSEVLGLNTYKFLDFTIKKKKIFIMKNRIKYKPGSEISFIHGFFFVLSEIGYKNFDYLEHQIKSSTTNHKSLYLSLLDQLRRGEKISDLYEDIHLNVTDVNIKKSDVLDCFN